MGIGIEQEASNLLSENLGQGLPKLSKPNKNTNYNIIIYKCWLIWLWVQRKEMMQQAKQINTSLQKHCNHLLIHSKPKVFSSLNNVAASRMRENSMQNAWTSMNRSLTARKYVSYVTIKLSHAHKPAAIYDMMLISNMFYLVHSPSIILLRIRLCKNTHTSRTSLFCMYLSWKRQYYLSAKTILSFSISTSLHFF